MKKAKIYKPNKTAMQSGLGKIDKWIIEFKTKDPTKKTLNKFYFLSGLWNSMPNKNFNSPLNNEISNFYFDPIIIHLAGIRRRDRLKFIKKYKKLFI